MDYLPNAELKTHLYDEITQEIVRDDDAIITEAIATAVDEVKGYLTKYDLPNIFTFIPIVDTPTYTIEVWTANRNKKLLSVVKDVAAWQLLKLSNPNIELPLRKLNYEFALDWLKGTQRGQIDPLLPLPNPSNTPLGNGGDLDGTIKWESNAKRNNHF